MKKLVISAVSAAVAVLASSAVQAADWSDTSLSYKYGSNFFNADLLMSDDKDPSSHGATNGAHEVYVVYRHTLDLGKATGVHSRWAACAASA